MYRDGRIPAFSRGLSAIGAVRDERVRAELAPERRFVAPQKELDRARRGFVAVRDDLLDDEAQSLDQGLDSVGEQRDEAADLDGAITGRDEKDKRIHCFTVTTGTSEATGEARPSSTRLATTGSIGLYASGCSS